MEHNRGFSIKHTRGALGRAQDGPAHYQVLMPSPNLLKSQILYTVEGGGGGGGGGGGEHGTQHLTFDAESKSAKIRKSF